MIMMIRYTTAGSSGAGRFSVSTRCFELKTDGEETPSRLGKQDRRSAACLAGESGRQTVHCEVHEGVMLPEPFEAETPVKMHLHRG